MGSRDRIEFPERFPPRPLPAAPRPSLLPRARVLGAYGEGAPPAELGRRLIPDEVRARLLGASSAWPWLAYLLLYAILLVITVRVEIMSTTERMMANVAALGMLAGFAPAFRSARRLAHENVRFLQQGIVVVPQVEERDAETVIFYEYQDGETRRVQPIHRRSSQPLGSPIQVIYDPAQPTEPRIVHELYPDLIVEANVVRFRDPSPRAPAIWRSACVVLAVVLGVLAIAL